MPLQGLSHAMRQMSEPGAPAMCLQLAAKDYLRFQESFGTILKVMACICAYAWSTITLIVSPAAC